MKSTETAKIPWLPPEIIIEIVEHAAFRTRKVYDPQHTYYVKELASFCLVSKSFYDITAPLLYRDVIIPTNLHIFQLLPHFYPLLSPEKRCELYELAIPYRKSSEGEIEENTFFNRESKVDPRWVRSLVILESPHGGFDRLLVASSEEWGLLWRFIEETVERMTGLERICWEPKHYSPRLSDAFSRLENLSHLACSNTESFCGWGAGSASLKPLESLSVYWKESTFKRPMPYSLRKMLNISSRSLKTLHLSTRNILADESAFIIERLFKIIRLDDENSEDEDELHKKPLKLENVEELLLDTRCTPKVTAAILQAIDFSRLTHLQLGYCESADRLLLAAMHQGLRCLRKVSLHIAPGPIVQFLNSFEGLREIYIIYSSEDPAQITTKKFDTEDILKAAGRHGKTLRILMLSIRARKDLSTVKAAQLSKLAECCPDLEQLRFDPDFDEWAAIVTVLSQMRSLQHILVVEHRGYFKFKSLFDASRDQKLCLIKSPTSEALDSFERVVGILIEASVTEAASLHMKNPNNCHFTWREYSRLRSITISAPESREARHTKSYVLREGRDIPLPIPREPRFQFKFGGLYFYEAHGVCISLHHVNSRPEFDRQVDCITIPLCGWHKAFVSPSFCMSSASKTSIAIK